MDVAGEVSKLSSKLKLKFVKEVKGTKRRKVNIKRSITCYENTH